MIMIMLRLIQERKLSVKLNIYFHRDFDGITSAALLTKIFTGLNMYDEFEYTPVDYDIKDKWLETGLKQPSAVLDFLYHPEAVYYFDHHTTSFIDEADKYSFVETDSRFWNPKFKSTPSLLEFKFKSYFNFYDYADLIKWSDIIDSAEYSSPKDLYDYNNPYILLNKLISYYYSDTSRILEILEAILCNKIDLFLSKHLMIINKIHENEMKNINLVKSKMIVSDNICFFDQSMVSIGFQRYLSYYFYPEIDYTIAIYKKAQNYSISVGYNPWKNENPIDLGEIATIYGGGGRHNVAGIITETHNGALTIAANICNALSSVTKDKITYYSR